MSTTTGNAILLIKEDTRLTFKSPTTALSGAGTVSHDPVQNKIVRRELGRNPSPIAHTIGTQQPTLSIEQVVEPDNTALMLQTLGMQVASAQVDATSAYDHMWSFDNDARPATASWQMQRGLHGTVSSVNGRGFEVGSITLAAAIDDYLRMTSSWVGSEVTPAGVNFGNGNTSPATIAVSYANVARAFQFSDITITVGGTAAFAANKYTVSGATTLDRVEGLELTIETGKTPRPVLGSCYNPYTTPGERLITGTLTIQVDPPTLSYLSKMLANTQEPLVVTAVGTEIETGYNFEYEVFLPIVSYDSADLVGTVNAARAAQTVSLPFTALWDQTNDRDIVIRYRNTATSY
jgi:hypothetical protein